jgi:zeaxanthin glucosyltransferase
MAIIGTICPRVPGHLNPLTTLCRELQRRGHRVIFYQTPLAAERIRARGFEVRCIGEKEFSPEEALKDQKVMATLSGYRAFRHTRDSVIRVIEVIIRQVPAMLREDNVDLMLVDQLSMGGGTASELAGVPFLSICNALMVNRDELAPPFFTNWPYRSDRIGRLRNWAGNTFFEVFGRRLLRILNDLRREHGVRPFERMSQEHSTLGQIAQQPAEFEFPRRSLPEHVYFTGPWHDPSSRPAVEFPFEKLDGRPLVYASMGTLQNRQHFIFGVIAEACAGLDVQLVLSLGGGGKPEDLGKLAGNPIVVESAPQLKLLERAAMCITHAGLNTALECLSNGVPMLAIPIANDQPGVAARIVWTGTGEMVPLSKLNAAKLRTAIQHVLGHEKYRENTRKLQHKIGSRDGVLMAADLIEEALSEIRSAGPPAEKHTAN